MFLACLLWTGFVGARTERVIIQGDHGKLMAEAEVLVLAAPIYYFTLNAQIQAPFSSSQRQR